MLNNFKASQSLIHQNWPRQKEVISKSVWNYWKQEMIFQQPSQNLILKFQQRLSFIRLKVNRLTHSNSHRLMAQKLPKVET